MIRPKLISLYVFVDNIDRSLAFYEALGLDVEKVSDMLGRAFSEGDAILEFGTDALTTSYDNGFQPPPEIAKGTINFEWPSVQAIDETYSRMIGEGYKGHLAPCSPPWQARFSILLDPDGNQVGLHSARDIDQDRKRE